MAFGECNKPSASVNKLSESEKKERRLSPSQQRVSFQKGASFGVVDSTNINTSEFPGKTVDTILKESCRSFNLATHKGKKEQSEWFLRKRVSTEYEKSIMGVEGNSINGSRKKHRKSEKIINHDQNQNSGENLTSKVLPKSPASENAITKKKHDGNKSAVTNNTSIGTEVVSFEWIDCIKNPEKGSDVSQPEGESKGLKVYRRKNLKKAVGISSSISSEECLLVENGNSCQDIVLVKATEQALSRSAEMECCNIAEDEEPGKQARDLCISFLRQEVLDYYPGAGPLTEHPGVVGDGVNHQGCKQCGLLENAESWICDSCEKIFHMNCCKPSARIKASHDYYCSTCWIRKRRVLGEPTNYQNESKYSYFLRTISNKNVCHTSQVRIGDRFQADIPDCMRNKKCLDSSFLGVVVPTKEVYTQNELKEYHSENNVWLKGWQSARSLPPGSKENWLECKAVVVKKGSTGSDGQKAKNDIVCGKWRRAPLSEEQTDKWECSCAILWDPGHADCCVPQELETEEIEKRRTSSNMNDNTAVLAMFAPTVNAALKIDNPLKKEKRTPMDDKGRPLIVFRRKRPQADAHSETHKDIAQEVGLDVLTEKIGEDVAESASRRGKHLLSDFGDVLAENKPPCVAPAIACHYHYPYSLAQDLHKDHGHELVESGDFPINLPKISQEESREQSSSSRNAHRDVQNVCCDQRTDTDGDLLPRPVLHSTSPPADLPSLYQLASATLQSLQWRDSVIEGLHKDVRELQVKLKAQEEEKSKFESKSSMLERENEELKREINLLRKTK